MCDASTVFDFLQYIRQLVPVMLSTQQDDRETMDIRSEDLKKPKSFSLNRDIGVDDEIARFKDDETIVSPNGLTNLIRKRR